MGSFSFTCAVSGFPIERGDRVRYALLTENPYDDNLRGEQQSHWFPRTWPLRARYDDYGSVEEVEGGAVQQAWLEPFKIDLKPVGVGDNSVHDVATSKDMSFEEMLKAVWEGRIQVKRRVPLWAAEPEAQEAMREARERSVQRGHRDRLKRTIPKGVPTLNRVTTTLTKAGFTVNGDTWGEGLLVDALDYGQVRVRAAHGDEASLANAQALLSRYASVIRAGTGSYANSAELFVCVKPGTEGYHGQLRGKRKGLRVAQMMIREDVWQAICSSRVESGTGWTPDNTLQVGHFREAAKLAWATVTDKNGSPFAGLARQGHMGWFLDDRIPFAWGLGSSFKWVARKFRRGEMTEAEVQPFLDSAAEYAFIGWYLGWVRHQWRPSYSNGPQFGEWGMHRSFLMQLLDVVNRKV